MIDKSKAEDEDKSSPMAQIKCSNCGGVLATETAACPHCATKAGELIESKPGKIESRANMLGSISAAVSEEYNEAECSTTLKAEGKNNGAKSGSNLFSWVVAVVIGVKLLLLIPDSCSETKPLYPPGESPAGVAPINLGTYQDNPNWSSELGRSANETTKFNPSIDKYVPKTPVPSGGTNSEEKGKPTGLPELLRRP
jgi:hypothetical protein